MPRCCHGQSAINGLKTITFLEQQLGIKLLWLPACVRGLRKRRKADDMGGCKISSLTRTRTNVYVKTEAIAMAPKRINLTWVRPPHNDRLCMRHLGIASFHSKGWMANMQLWPICSRWDICNQQFKVGPWHQIAWLKQCVRVSRKWSLEHPDAVCLNTCLTKKWHDAHIGADPLAATPP